MKIIVKNKKEEKIFENYYYNKEQTSLFLPFIVTAGISIWIFQIFNTSFSGWSKGGGPSYFLLFVIILFPLFALGCLALIFRSIKNNKSVEIDLDKRVIEGDEKYKFINLYYKIATYNAGRLSTDYEYAEISTQENDGFILKIDMSSFIELKEYIDKNSAIKIVKN